MTDDSSIRYKFWLYDRNSLYTDHHYFVYIPLYFVRYSLLSTVIESLESTYNNKEQVVAIVIQPMQKILYWLLN